MDFSELALMQAKTKDLRQRRSGHASQDFEQGLALLQQAIDEQFSHKHRLEQALAYFLTAIRLQRSNPEPYLAAAYLFLLVRDANRALSYIKCVRELQPDHPELPQWLAFFDHSGKVPLEPPPAADADRLHDALQQQIQALAKHLRPPTPSPDPVTLRSLQQEQAGLRQQLQDFNLRCDALDQELDTGDLRQALLPLEGHLAQLQSAIEAVFKQVQLQHALERLLENVRKQLTQPIKEPSLLEKTLDQCDFYADQLDQLEADGYSIAALKVHYIRVIRAVEAWQEALDEF
ncbi:MAG: hypothetical protein CVV27_10075 [Candidatus Melainabacteria bacterium HGW-Melainabacteria-1]|nr:MAG: hypothetical protein CVV27_10075 [Candidatus Melainabacteria bacterium HGW-Melainabacteria-1]